MYIFSLLFLTDLKRNCMKQHVYKQIIGTITQADQYVL